ncbi:MAG: type I DNA topoisomerase [bacterium]|nr:type I DNA topoisomerase [bacterium]
MAPYKTKTTKKRSFKIPKTPAYIKNLLIVESPAKCKTISKILGKDYVVIATLGHIRDLPKRKMGVDFENNFEPTYEISSDKKAQAKSLVEHIKNADQVFLAPDEDREGEAIAWHVIEASKIAHDKFKRITFHEITPSAIKAAVKNPRKMNYDVVNAQQARRILDRLVGYKLSPLLGKKIMKGLSAGRVQSSTLKIVVDREREIQNFIKEEYWSISAACNKNNIEFKADFIEKAGKKYKKLDIKNETQALAILEDITKKSFFVNTIEAKSRKKAAKPPFITSTLQQAASYHCGFSSKKTMAVAQMLYEGVALKNETVGLITYMRTDSTNIAKSAISEIRDFIQQELGDKYLSSKIKTYTKKAKGAQEAHECIRATSMFRTPDSLEKYLTSDQFKLYQLIWKRTVACQINEAIFDQNIITLKAKNTLWQSIGETLVFDGYLKIYHYDKNTKDTILPQLETGENIAVTKIEPKQHFTEPPPRYTEATLIKTLEKNGIGRPSTYAPTISTVTARGYIEIEKKKIIPQKIGFKVTEALENFFPNIVNAHFTAEMETDLDKVAEGEVKWLTMLQNFYEPFIKTIDNANTNMSSQKEVHTTGEKCPKCESDLVTRQSRYGEFIGCSNYPKCKYIKPDKKKQKEMAEDEKKAEELDPCPLCNNSLVIKNSSYGKFIACNGYPKCRYSQALNAEKIDKKCPECNSPLVIKNSRRGQFLGCSNYPKCKHIENLAKNKSSDG